VGAFTCIIQESFSAVILSDESGRCGDPDEESKDPYYRQQSLLCQAATRDFSMQQGSFDSSLRSALRMTNGKSQQ